MKVLWLDRICLNVENLAEATTFYGHALGFSPAAARDADPALADLLGARSLRTIRMQRGKQILELAEFDPSGAAYPENSRSDDLWFQHCALVTENIAAAYERLSRSNFTPISRRGPETLPGGIVAFKFRDPAGHPLELIQFPKPDPRTQGGIDHSAISVADVGRSIAFYAGRLGLGMQSRQVNEGPAQAALDDLDAPVVDVVGMTPELPAPHVELLGYRTPRGRSAPSGRPSDIAASRLVFATDGPPLPEEPSGATLSNGTRVVLLHDPDGHAVLLEQRPSVA